MQRAISRWGNWIDDRTGFITAARLFLQEQIPQSAGWPQVFGSVALFALLIQIFTGVLLSFNFAPTVRDAYPSLQYIIHQVASGRMIHGLHHWGASMMVIVVVLHMAQVFIYGAYKRPREATWLAGVALLFLTLGFALTGYLLPWDNRAYWGTMVTARIVADLPVFGDTLSRLMGAQQGVGAVTFARFYALHTIVLPAAAVLLTVIHVYLVRRHGVAATGPRYERTQHFYPNQLARDVCAIFVAFCCLFLAAALLEVPLEKMADPTDATYVPRPEWYFLFLFQLLKAFPGRFEFIGTVVLPTCAVACLVLLPFLPRLQRRWLSGRLSPALITVLVFAGWMALTGAAYQPTSLRRSNLAGGSASEQWIHMPPAHLAGFGYFHSSGCDSCHNIIAGSPKPGPTLGAMPLRHPKDWLASHVVEHSKPAVTNGAVPRDLQNTLIQFAQSLGPEWILRNQSSPPPQLVHAAQIYGLNGCANCHRVNTVGGNVGPPLNGLGGRRSEDWVRLHFQNPRKLSPGSIMPPYRFEKQDEADLVAYLELLPE